MGEEWGASTPWQYFTDHTDPGPASAVSAGRTSEFTAHGWDADQVPDPQDPRTHRDSTLDWGEVVHDPHARLLGWYRDLIRLRRERPGLYDGRPDGVYVDHDPVRGTFSMRRGDVQVLVNLSDRSAAFDVDGPVLLSWDAGVSAVGGAVEVPARSAAVVGS